MMSRSKSHPVALSAVEREMLVRLVRTGSHPAQQVRRGRILLELDENDPIVTDLHRRRRWWRRGRECTSTR